MCKLFSGLLKFPVQVPVPHFNSGFLLPFLTLQTFNLVEGGEGEWLFLSHLLWQGMGDGGELSWTLIFKIPINN